MNRRKKQDWDKVLDSYIDRILSLQDDRKLNLFNTGIIIDLKDLQRITLKNILKAMIKDGKITLKKSIKRDGKND